MSDFASAFLVICLTLVSGLADARGFIHASTIWEGGRFDWSEAGRSALGFALGVLAYWLALRYLKGLGVVSPEIQTLIWFGVTIAGVAILSGSFGQWRVADQSVAVVVLAGIGWLLFRTGS